MNPLARKIGGRVTKCRIKKGWTLQELAERLHTSKGYLSDIENGVRLPTIEMVARIARKLGVPLRKFF